MGDGEKKIVWWLLVWALILGKILDWFQRELGPFWSKGRVWNKGRQWASDWGILKANKTFRERGFFDYCKYSKCNHNVCVIKQGFDERIEILGGKITLFSFIKE